MNPRERERPVLPLPSQSSLLRTAFLLLLLVSATWLLGLLAVNSDTLSFHYLFAAFSCLQVGASSHLLGSLCDLCPGAATVRRGCWGRGTGGGGAPVLALAEEEACVLYLSQPCLQALSLSGHCRALGRIKLVSPTPPPPTAAGWPKARWCSQEIGVAFCVSYQVLLPSEFMA